MIGFLSLIFVFTDANLKKIFFYLSIHFIHLFMDSEKGKFEPNFANFALCRNFFEKSQTTKIRK